MLPRTPPAAREAPLPMWTPSTSRAAIPAIVATTVSLMVVLPRSLKSGLSYRCWFCSLIVQSSSAGHVNLLAMVPQIPLAQPPARAAGLAGGVDERAHPLGLHKLVVELDRLPCLPDVRGDAAVLEHPQGVPGDAEPLVEAPREHHCRGAVLEQLLD